MKIRTIEITGFGRWTNTTIDSLADWQVFTGANEAGKSTLKAFILGIFFGFSLRGDQKYIPRSGAQYGGALVVETKTGRYRISRINRTKSILTVTNLDTGQVEADAEGFLTELFNPLTQADYEQIFAFNEQDLSQVSQLTGPDLEKRLLTYTEPQAQNWLNWADQEASQGQQLFSKQKTGKRPLNVANQEYQDLLDQRQSQADSLAEYLGNDGQLSQIQDKLTEKRREVEKLNQEIQDKKALQATWPLFEELQATRHGVGQQRPAANVNEADYQRGQKLGLDLNWVNQQLEQIQQQLQAQQKRRDTVQQDSDKAGILQAIRANSAILAANQEKANKLTGQLTRFQQYFTGPIPKPLTRRQSALLERTNPWVATAIVSFVALLGSAAIIQSVLIQSPLALATIGFAFMASVRGQKAHKIRADYAPLSVATILSSQDQVQKAANAQNELNEGVKQQQLLIKELVHDLQDFDAKKFAYLQTYSGIEDIDRVLVAAKDAMASEERRPEQAVSDRVRLDDMLHQQQTLIKQKDQVQADIQELLHQTGLTDLKQLAETLQEQGGQAAKQQRIADIEGQLGEETLAKLGQYQSLAAIETAQSQLAQSRQQSQDEFADLQKQQQDLQVRQASLVSAEEYQALTQKLANAESDLQEQFAQYLTASLLPQTLKTAFSGQDVELSTNVTEQAGDYLARLTKGKYNRLILTDKKVRVIQSNGEEFAIGELSTGAIDQVYLAVRFALVKSLPLKEKLPILIDDGFVNFDATRKEEVLALIQELAVDQQVLFWTFDEANPTGSQQIKLGEING